MQMTLKQWKPARNLSSAKPRLLLQCYIFFAVSIRDWFDLTHDLQSSPKLPFLCSVFSFQADCLISPLHRSLQGQRAKGNCRKDGGEKSHTSMWTAAQTAAPSRTGRAFSRWWRQLTWQKMKVSAVELYINHCLSGEEPGSVSVEHKELLRGAGSSCHGDVLHQQSQKEDQETWKLLQLKQERMQNDRMYKQHPPLPRKPQSKLRRSWTGRYSWIQ